MKFTAPLFVIAALFAGAEAQVRGGGAISAEHRRLSGSTKSPSGSGGMMGGSGSTKSPMSSSSPMGSSSMSTSSPMTEGSRRRDLADKQDAEAW